MQTDFAPDALEQVLYGRHPERSDAVIHHSDSNNVYASHSWAI